MRSAIALAGVVLAAVPVDEIADVRGGILLLRDSATLASTAGLNLEFGTLNLDNSLTVSGVTTVAGTLVVSANQTLTVTNDKGKKSSTSITVKVSPVSLVSTDSSTLSTSCSPTARVASDP